jgi:hypothetical protein
LNVNGEQLRCDESDLRDGDRFEDVHCEFVLVQSQSHLTKAREIERNKERKSKRWEVQ